MATVLDLGLLQAFDFIFPVILVFSLVFALLQKTKAIGDSVGINAMIAVAASFMILLSQSVIDIINFMIPWFTIAIIFFVLVIVLFQTFGLKDADIASAVKDKAVYWTLIGVVLIIAFAGIATVLGPQVSPDAQLDEDGNVIEPADGGFQQDVTKILFHPKVLGLIILFGIMVFAVFLLTSG